MAELHTPTGVAVDASGNVYVADEANNRIRRIDPAGNVTTVAGNGGADFADGTGGRDGGAEFRLPNGVAVDAQGDVFVADFGTNRIRKIDPTGIVTTVAGSGAAGFADGPALNASFHGPTGIAVDGQGNLFVADSLNQRIRKIDTSGRVTSLAGTGAPGFADGPGGPDGGAQFRNPNGVAVDETGNVYVADVGNGRVRRIATAGLVTTVAGNGTIGLVDGSGGPDGGAEFNGPSGVALDAQGNLYVADYANNCVRRIDPAGNVTTVAGTGQPGFADGTGGLDGGAQLNTPVGVAVDAQGRIYVADSANERIRRIDTAGEVTSVGGNGAPGDADGPLMAPATAEFSSPSGVSVDPLGNLLVADTGNHRVRRITVLGTVETVATGPDGGGGFNAPLDVVVDAQGNAFVADTGNNRIRKIDSQGKVTTVAGTGVAAFADGAGGDDGGAAFSAPAGIAIDAAGNLFVADTGNNRIRRIDLEGRVTTVAGNGNVGFRDGTGGPQGTAEFTLPERVGVDATGRLVVVDYGNLCIRQIDPAGNVTTLAGNGYLGFVDGTGGASGTAEFNFPQGLTVEASGVAYVADSGNNALRRIGLDGQVTTIAGTGDPGFANGWGAPASAAEFSYPIGLARDASGTLYVADAYNNCIRRVAP